mgnify:CR=1 FL=1
MLEAVPPVDVLLSLIHIFEPTRPYLISYAVFCLKKKINLVCLLLLEHVTIVVGLVDVGDVVVVVVLYHCVAE